VQRDVIVRGRKGKMVLSAIATPAKEHDKTIGAIQILHDVTRDKEVDRMKTEFISLASHQLRTPLGAIKWYTEMLRGGDAGKLNHEQSDYLTNIDMSADRMGKLVGALLNISRIESGRIIVDPQPVNLRSFMDGIVTSMQEQLHRRKQKIAVTIDGSLDTMTADQRLIGEVYLNLLTNASKYTPEGGKITITVKPKGNEIVTSISDNGYGIPKAEQPKIFQKFFRATNILHIETDGTGLGLYLVKSIIESSNGRIWFESHEGKGTTFNFTLPRSGTPDHGGEVKSDE
jgi:signal transduction histidine kinase